MTYPFNILISFSILAVNIVQASMCAILVWWHRKEVTDHSRTIFALLAFSMVIPFCWRLYQLATQPDNYAPTEVLSPFKVYNGLLFLTLLTLYPTEIMRPHWLKVKTVFIFLLPFLFFTTGAVLIGPHTELHSVDDVWRHAGKLNVWWRLVSMFVSLVMFYIFLLRFPFNWRHSSASRRWVRRYAMLMTPIGICFYLVSFTFTLPLHIIHILYLAFFIVYYTYYELFLRILPPPVSSDQSPDEPADPEITPISSSIATPSEHAAEEQLFQEMDQRIEREHLFCNPDFGRDDLCRLTCLSRARIGTFLQNFTDASNSQVYINRKRIAYAAQMLLEHPEYSIEAVAFDAGFRAKATFHRLFKEQYDTTPAAYRSDHLSRK